MSVARTSAAVDKAKAKAEQAEAKLKQLEARLAAAGGGKGGKAEATGWVIWMGVGGRWWWWVAWQRVVSQ